MNPIFLLKEEPQYEPCIRGMVNDADVQTLFNVFRSVASEELPVELNSLSLLCIEDVFGTAASKITELQDAVTQSKSSTSFLTLRLRTRISHLMGLLKHLTTLGPFLSRIMTSHN
jgi:hypothetical protein